jgi:catechol-2,3-dioxygenase
VMVFGSSGRALYVDDPDGNVVELWTWDVGEHLR